VLWSWICLCQVESFGKSLSSAERCSSSSTRSVLVRESTSPCSIAFQNWVSPAERPVTSTLRCLGDSSQNLSRWKA
jgi:hypothetical protein